MITSLSILLPTYNTPCVGIVKSLHEQALSMPFLSFEIVVLDDGSTDTSVIATNQEINNLSHCRFQQRGYNRGRAVTRNELSSLAKFEWLLFIDSDMSICSSDYLRRYVELDEADVTYGGYVVNGDKKKLRGNLRYRYEIQYEGNRSASKRKEHPYDDFHTSNFLVRRAIMSSFPLDERFVSYGYEDVIWGKTMKENGIKIRHIDNPVSFEIFEDNEDFLSKTNAGITTLFSFRGELGGYSRIISVSDRLERLRLAKPFARMFKIIQHPIKKCLVGNNPIVFLFSIYKVGMYLIKLSEK